MGKIVDIEGLNSKQKLLFFAVCLVLLIVFTTLLSSLNFGNKVIDYANTSIYDLLIDSEETTDRDTYWTLNGIILDFMRSYQTVEKMDTSSLVEYHYTGYSLEDYFKALDREYQKYLGKKNYIETAKNMISKMVTWNENGFVLKEENIINTIYKMDKYDGYICLLNSENLNEETYIGIIMDKEKEEYNIFYIQ